MPPKEDTTWWRGKHGFQVRTTNTHALSVAFPLAVNFGTLVLEVFQGQGENAAL